tara:strand:+ start:41 stop:196 length:156 start_codon:yes stop_codon:yes gene_type:complete
MLLILYTAQERNVLVEIIIVSVKENNMKKFIDKLQAAWNALLYKLMFKKYR